MVDENKKPDLGKLVTLVARLRAPDGCPWDQKQTLPDMRAYLLEEAHEVAAAIDRGDWNDLADEMGDLLFQIVFLGQLGQENDAFDLQQVIDRIHQKMIDRHPHVFGGNALANAEEVKKSWELRKARKASGTRALLAGVETSLPALLAAYRMTQKASGVGFDWPDLAGVEAKIAEELQELSEAIHPPEPTSETKAQKDAIREEIGDVLFSIVNLARKLEIDPEAALAATNLKFRRRFGAVEEGLQQQGIPFEKASLEDMDALWNKAKAREREI
ncbi:MAG: nucleoside triphosphate pyrophosphohydrolase [Deltaproteobacteria bacterium]|nr:nucleoside triphosphate pyrophosphohydrolase [Deltaproteobacteria bacterium]